MIRHKDYDASMSRRTLYTAVHHQHLNFANNLGTSDGQTFRENQIRVSFDQLAHGQVALDHLKKTNLNARD